MQADMSTQLSTKLAQDDIIAERCASAPTIDYLY